ncbi:hypothetical protein [Flavobacterium sp.]|uniref:hypothetical protein n=1 Tax=Flavobacterium sp. TaxID=239 RepID=UPI00260541CF|nr:hypothetical protein [Flavobacterium sp.]
MKIKAYLILFLFIINHLTAQRRIMFNEPPVDGVIFTQSYFGAKSKAFTPTKTTIQKIELFLRNSKIDFSKYKRQYAGFTFNNQKYVEVTLLPNEVIKHHKDWRLNYVLTQDDNRIYTVRYYLTTKEMQLFRQSGGFP